MIVMRCMKRDGRALDHTTLQEFRLLAVRRVREGEKASAVVRSLGMNRTSIYRWLKAEADSGQGERALLARPITGRPSKLTAAQQAQVLGWIDGKDPRQYGLEVGLWTRQIMAVLHEADAEPKDWPDRSGQDARPPGADAAKALAARLPARPQGHPNAGSAVRGRPLLRRRGKTRPTSTMCCRATHPTSIPMNSCGVTSSARVWPAARCEPAKSWKSALKSNYARCKRIAASFAHSFLLQMSPIFGTYE